MTAKTIIEQEIQALQGKLQSMNLSLVGMQKAIDRGNARLVELQGQLELAKRQDEFIQQASTNGMNWEQFKSQSGKPPIPQK